MVGCGGMASVLKGKSSGDLPNNRSNGVMPSSRGEEMIPHCMVWIKLNQYLVL